ncbi:MAG: hypothetical protein M1132_12530 [Chloroflexi bacterium]|nr:hypothetical protein [Chloroflexota bacterium]
MDLRAPKLPSGFTSPEHLPKRLQTFASDGTLNLPPGFRGSLNAHGWQLVSGENEPPPLTQVSLVNGSNASGCGGSIAIPAGARLTLDGARLLDNKASEYTGGAACVQANGRADIQNTLFTSSQARIGAGIMNYGTAGIVHSTL